VGKESDCQLKRLAGENGNEEGCDVLGYWGGEVKKKKNAI